MTTAERDQLRSDEMDLAIVLIAHGLPGGDWASPSECFSDPTAQAAMVAAETIKGAGGMVAIKSVIAELVRSGKAEALGGHGKLTADLNNPEATSMALLLVAEVRKRVLECHRKRRLEAIRDRGTREGKDPAEIAAEIIEADKLLASHHAPPFRALLSEAAKGGTAFLGMAIPERPALIGDWFREGDLGFVFAPRGVGKTWFTHALIAALTSGRDVGGWAVPSSVRVCLLDGEMPPGDVQERLTRLGVKGDKLTVLSHQFLFDIGGRSFQLSEPEQRAALLDFCATEKIRVLVIDNLSSVSNISENDNDEWPALGDWLLDFRRRGIAVIVVHHAGRNGQMRGMSRREDPAFWVIRLDDSRVRTATTEGARFVVTFTKARNSRQWPTPTDWHVTSDEDGNLAINYEIADNAALVLQAIKDGLNQCSDIAAELDLSKGAVSKLAHRLESSGQIRIDGRRYVAN